MKYYEVRRPSEDDGIYILTQLDDVMNDMGDMHMTISDILRRLDEIEKRMDAREGDGK